MPLPLFPHCDLELDCCWMLMEVMEESGLHLVRNERGAKLSKEEVAPLIRLAVLE